ncbi:hypothetical protein [Amycolatopsis thermoflava]|uniref:hypothetical protein n=1 Tax=Amycolatopsis thermoflava TaxID=84480 RepID=UPI003D76054C
MAKQTFPGLKTGSGLLPKVATALVVLALLAIVVKHPADAATWAKSLGSGIGAIIDGIATFVRQLSA